MRKKATKIISLVLAVISVLSVFTICFTSASAATDSTKSEYEILLSKRYDAVCEMHDNGEIESYIQTTSVYDKKLSITVEEDGNEKPLTIYYDGKHINFVNPTDKNYYRMSSLLSGFFANVLGDEIFKGVTESNECLVYGGFQPLSKAKSVKTEEVDGQSCTVYTFKKYKVYIAKNKVVQLEDADGIIKFLSITESTGIPSEKTNKGMKRIYILSNWATIWGN